MAKEIKTAEGTNKFRWENFINNLPDEFYWHKDNSDRIIFSENIVSVTGYGSEELNTIEEIIFEADRSDYILKLKGKLNEQKKFIQSEFRILSKPGKIKWVRESLHISYNESGKAENFYGKIQDISRTKESELKLNEIIKELENQNTAKDNFLTLLSHDLRSPFTSILGFTEILLKESSLTESERNEYLTFIYSSSEKLLQLINYLLDWSRLRSGKLIIQKQKINFQSLIYSCISSLTGFAVRKNIDVKVEADKSLYVIGDERLLTLVLINLINNSIKYSYKESEIKIKAEKFSNSLVELVITDNGTGISENNKNKLFKIDKIFSAPGTLGEKGTGFGLILTKEIIEKHNGQIWFYSEEKKGSEFHINIPSIQNSILIVNPDEEWLNKIYFSIKEDFRDYGVLKAKSASEAIRYADSLPSVIVVPDKLPLMTGYQVLDSMHRNTGSKMKIIIISDLNENTKTNYLKFGEVVFTGMNPSYSQVSDSLKKLLN